MFKQFIKRILLNLLSFKLNFKRF